MRSTRSPAPSSNNAATPSRSAPRLIESWVPDQIGSVLVALSVSFMAVVLSDTAGFGWIDSVPLPARFFTQIACLFPHAATELIDYRAEGYVCKRARFEEIDVGPFFPIDRGEKENRFYRAMQFYRQNRPTMQALDAYVVNRHNEAVLAAKAQATGEETGELIGGVRFSSLRIPLGSTDAPVARYERRPMSAYPESEVKHWYYTRRSRRAARCRELEPGSPPVPDDARPSRGSRHDRTRDPHPNEAEP